MTALNSRSYAGVVCIVLLIGTNIFMGMALYRSYYSFSLDDGSTMDLYVIMMVTIHCERTADFSRIFPLCYYLGTLLEGRTMI